VTLNGSLQAGQVTSREPGRGLSLRRRSQAGQPSSTLTTFGLTENCTEQELHCTFAGRLSTPTTNTFEQAGQATFSSSQLLTVAS